MTLRAHGRRSHSGMPRLSAVEFDAEAQRGQVAAIPAISGIREVTSGASPVELVDTLKNKRARTVPLVPVVVPIVDRWSAGKSPGEWLFAAPAGGPLRETNWQRSVSWRDAKATIGRTTDWCHGENESGKCSDGSFVGHL